MEYSFEFESIPETSESPEKNFNTIKLDKLDEDERKIIDPLVPPTSGLRMVIFDVQDKNYTMTRKQTFYFLRVIKGISVVAKEELGKDSPNVLVVTDDRPSADILLDLSSRIFAFEGYTVYHQMGKGETDPEVLMFVDIQKWELLMLQLQ